MNDEKDEEKTEDTKYLIAVGVLIISAIVVGVTALISFSVRSPAGATWVSKVYPFLLVYVFLGYAFFWLGLLVLSEVKTKAEDERAPEVAYIGFSIVTGLYVVGAMFQVFIPNSSFGVSLAFAILIAVIVTAGLALSLKRLFNKALDHDNPEVIFSAWAIVALTEPLVALACVNLPPFV